MLPQTIRRLLERASPRPPVDLFGEETGDAAYLAARNFYVWRPVREQLEEAWRRLWRHCPEGPEQFVRQFRQDFHARSWELFLLAVLADAGLTILPTTGTGPDICIRLRSGKKAWIEAVAPGPGTGPNAVFQPPPGAQSGSLGPQANVILRYTQALQEKLNKLTVYKAAGIVQPDDAYLIAVSQGGIRNSDLHDDDVPLIVRAVFALGETVYRFTPYSGQPGRVEVPVREHVTKANGSAVSTTFFLDPQTEFVSGVIFVRLGVENLKWSAEDSLGLVHRPHARVPVERGAIPTRCEMWLDEQGVLMHRGKCAMFGTYAHEVVPLRRRVRAWAQSVGEVGIRFRVWRLVRRERRAGRLSRPSFDEDLL
jgi:hypothetical protein